MATRPKQRVSRIATLAAPTGGIDDTNPIAGMDPHYAIEMTNIFPQNSSLRVRAGYKEWTTGLPANAKSLLQYSSQNSSTDKLFACTDAGMFDVTAQGVAGASVRTLTNGRVDYVMFANTAAQFMVVVNGSSENFMYDGTTYYPIVYNATPTTPGQIGGMTTPQNFTQVCSHKRRLWFVEKNSTNAWYLPTDAVAGAATQFLMGSIFKLGGYLLNIFSWTRGAGNGIEDILVFQSSNGELAGYSGSDPSSATTWSLEAVFFIGAPLGDRTFTDLGGDIALLNIYGVMSMSKIVGGTSSAGDTNDTLSKRISRTINELGQATNLQPGWELTSVPALQYLVLSVPATANAPAIQYIMNMLNGSWTTYNLPMLTCVQFHERLYFSDTTGRVYLYGNVFQDGILLDGSGGTPIVSGFMQAYSDFGDLGTDKHYKVVRPIFTCSVRPSYTVKANADYGPTRLASLQTPGPVTTQATNVWDNAIWDSGVWAEGQVSFYEWVGVSGVGYSAALLLKMRTSSDTEFVACNWAFEPGTAL